MNEITTKDKEELLSKIQLIHLKLGYLHYRLAHYHLNKCFKLKTKIYSKKEICDFLREQNLSKTFSLLDRKYWTIEWKDWRKIIKYDWIDKKKYIRERFDCDNFSFIFSANAGFFFGLNSCGVGFGTINNASGHLFNIILATDNGNLKAFIYEPIHDRWIKYQKFEKIIIGNWYYKVNWQMYF